MDLRRLCLDEAHVDILGICELVLVQRVVFNRSTDPIKKAPISSKF